MKSLKTLLGQGFKLGARGLLAAALAVTALGLAAAPASAATIVVNTTTDQALGSCSGSCSLRDAVATSADGDTVQIPAGHYVLTLGQIAISNKNLTLAGADARTTVIDGNAASGIFNISGLLSSEIAEVEIFDVSLINGNNPSGGAISGTLTVLILFNCTVANNQADTGGGINMVDGELGIVFSTFSNNSARLGGGGLMVDNSSGVFGGGGPFGGFGVVSLDSTFSGNVASGAMAIGIISSGDAVLLINNTITANRSNSASRGALSISSSGQPNAQSGLFNNIIAGNTGGDCQLTGLPIGTSNNLDSDNSCGLTGPGDLPGVDPLLGPLANNGGPTDTHALLGGSPAVNAGNNAVIFFPFDQRGVFRVQGPAVDIGAYEDTQVVISVNNASVIVNEGQTATNGGTMSDADGDPITLTASVGTVVDNGDGTWSWSFHATDPAQSQTVTITGTTDDGPATAGSVTFSLEVDDVAPGITSVTNNGPITAGGFAIITVIAADTTGGNDTLAYEFDCDNNGSFEIGPQAADNASCTFASAGSFTVNVRVTDGEGGSALGSTVVKVNPPPPDCSHAVASPNLLWPPDHRLVPVTISGVTNPGGGAVTISVTSIFQDEPVNSPGSGNTSPDATGVGTSSPSVRAERDGHGDGRVYHINFTATNGSGGTCTGSVTVGVPHDQGHGSPVDQGPLYNSTTP